MAGVAGSAGLLVLIVEDEPVQRMAAASTLRDAGMRVLEAATVEAATSALDAHPDLRVMVASIDLVGEPLTGLTLAKAVAARWREVSIVLVSGIIEPELEAMPQGARFLPSRSRQRPWSAL